ncbi:MAG: type IX secretion system PorP/SprF family membrane protein [Parvicella sp.]|jgi:type IX secretion system PorP/SprF family membrane protein
MKYLFNISIFLVLSLSSVKSQQTTQFTQYVFNYFAINPALAGSQDCFNFKLGFRDQWLQLDGSPQTGFASFQSRLKFKKSRANRTHHGVGGYIESDKIGYLSRTTLNLAYAYHFPVGRDVTASVGVFAGFQQFKVNASEILVENYDDPLLSGSGSAFFIPYVTPGLFLNHADWFIGYSVRQVVRNRWSKLIGDQGRNRWHHQLMGGKRFKLGDQFNVIPSAMIKWVRTTKPALDLNLLFEVNKAFEIGVSWRNEDALAAIAKVRFAKYFTVGYSYDITTSKLRHSSSNTHELIIGISACRHDRNSTYICPVFQ